jgi:MFS family permease
MTTARMNGAVRDPRFVLLATSLGVLLAQIDTSVVNLGLKSVAHDLNAGVSEMQWVIDAYNVVYATLLLTGGTLGDIYGRRRIFLLGIALFTAGTIVCALASNAVGPDRRPRRQRTGRGICAADVAGPVDPRLSAPRGARACDGYLGEL